MCTVKNAVWTLSNGNLFFDVGIIEKYFSDNENNKPITDYNLDLTNFFDDLDKLKNIPYEVFQKNKKETIDLLKKALIIKAKDINILDENDIVVHIRSGDLFLQERSFSFYTPPPLSYYTNILNNIKYNKIIIVSEDKKNPVIDELLKLYSNSIYSKNCLKDDIRIILGAKNIINSVGSFIPSLIMLSSNISKVYGTWLYEKELEKYYVCNKHGTWKNTKIQRDYMLNYQLSKD